MSYLYVNFDMYLCMCVYVFMHVYLCVYMCSCVYIYIYVQMFDFDSSMYVCLSGARILCSNW